MNPKLEIEHKKVWQLVKRAKYKQALYQAKSLLQKYPNEFSIQITYATVLGDAASNFTGKNKLLKKQEAIHFMQSLLKKIRWQNDTAQILRLKNEYYWQTKQRLKQYRLGIEKLGMGFKASGYYSQGVGAAWHAYQLASSGQIKRSQRWAKISIQAWKKFAKLQSYYNQYVHMALAYGVLNDFEKMETSFLQGAKLCGKSLNYHEFQEIRKLIKKLNS